MNIRYTLFFALEALVAAVALPTRNASAIAISTVSIDGQFSDSTGAFITHSMVPVNGSSDLLTFTNVTTGSQQLVPFAPVNQGQRLTLDMMSRVKH